MHHEGGISSERYEKAERSRPVFDLEQMEPYQISGLVTALGRAWESEEQGRGSTQDTTENHTYGNMLATVTKELRDAARTSDKAIEIYTGLLGGKSPHSRIAAVDMTSELLRRYLDNPEARQKIIDYWVDLLSHDQNVDVRGAAEHAMWKTVYHTDWLDQPTKSYLESQLRNDDEF